MLNFFTELWKSFDLIFCANTNNKIPGFFVCKKCKKVFRYNTKNGTSNPLQHFKQRHDSSQENLDNFVEKKRSFSMTSSERDRLIRASVQYVTKDIRPYKAIEGEGMIDLLHTIWNLGEKYGSVARNELTEILPCATTVSRQVRKLAKEKKEDLTRRLSSIFSKSLFIGITCDIWQDDYKHLSYLAITSHFYGNQMSLCDQLIAMPPLEPGQKKDANFIKRVLKLFLEERGIPFDAEKLIFVTDRGANIKKALDVSTRINCFPHFINNTVKHACKTDILETLLSACKKLVRYIKISGLNNEFEISIKCSVTTRFNSTLTMIESILLNWRKLNEILVQKNETQRLENIDFDILEQLKTFLEPFRYWSIFCETTLKPSLCNVWIGIDSIIKHCTSNENDDHLLAIMKVKALCYIEDKFVLHKFHRIATFLNPNYKGLRFSSQALYDLTLSDTTELLNKIPSIERHDQLQIQRFLSTLTNPWSLVKWRYMSN